MPRPRLGLHLRLSDNELVAKEYGGRCYTNKPLNTAEDFRRGSGAQSAGLGRAESAEDALLIRIGLITSLSSISPLNWRPGNASDEL